MTSNRPVHTVKLNGVSVAIFENEATNGRVYYTGQLVKSFRNPQGDWEDRKISLQIPDFILAVRALDSAVDWCLDHPLVTGEAKDALEL